MLVTALAILCIFVALFSLRKIPMVIGKSNWQAAMPKDFQMARNHLAIILRRDTYPLPSMRRIPVRAIALGRGFCCSQRGSVAISIAILLPILIGMTALGTEIPYVIFKQRQLQMFADVAAFSAAVALNKGYPDATVQGQAVAQQLASTNAAGVITVTVNILQSYKGYPQTAVEVIVV